MGPAHTCAKTGHISNLVEMLNFFFKTFFSTTENSSDKLSGYNGEL